MEPLPPPRPTRSPGPRPVADLLCLQSILYVLCNDIAWQPLPPELGFDSGQTCWRRLERWQRAGGLRPAEPNPSRRAERGRPPRLVQGMRGRLPHPREEGGADTGPSPVDPGGRRAADKRASCSRRSSANTAPTNRTPYWHKKLAGIADAFARDGFTITPKLDIRRQGEHRPEDAREGDAAHREALRILRGARNAMTRQHRLTRGMDEYRLRDVLLVALNGYFEGKATSETLNGDGKNDILLRIGDRNVLIVECNLWRGSAAMEPAMDQLLRYIDNGTRRAALVVFFRSNNTAPLIAGAVTAIKAHPNHDATDLTDSDGQWSFTIRGNGTPGPAPRAEVTFLPIVVA
ncbi:transposase [Streptomyces sp. NPDC090077]|uniref:transposase n=1 Tax=Streptomyces sp. NPDC090077 TaxID=3365938 RepID=UPI0037F62E32